MLFAKMLSYLLSSILEFISQEWIELKTICNTASIKSARAMSTLFFHILIN
jgi:hypothetical protein